MKALHHIRRTLPDLPALLIIMASLLGWLIIGE